MTSNNLFHSILSGGNSEPPAGLALKFHQMFPEATELEWHSDGEMLEAIFRQEGIEKIAFFMESGEWIDTRTNLSIEMIPQKLRSVLEENWEIMNAISIVSQKSTEFEFIVRDKEKNRYLLFTDDQGAITHQSAFREESIL